MRWVWIGGAVLAVLLGSMLAFRACQRSAVDASLDRSSAPLLVPTGEWRDAFDFTAPPGATDLYQFRWNFRPGGTEVVSGWQVVSTSTYEEAAIAEGPGQEIVDEVLRAARDERCVLVDAGEEIRRCSYPAEFVRGGANIYLVRLVGDHTLVVEELDRGGDRAVYDPDSLEARFLGASFEPVPIDDAAGDYLVYIY